MKKLLSILFILIFFIQYKTLIYAEEQNQTVFKLEEVIITAEKEETHRERKIESRALNAYKGIDLAEILSDEMVTVTLIRKSVYGNEVALRGFGQSNLRFLVDDTIVEGACGSRKDPPFSHINLLTVERIEVKEGPFDVTKPGALGGSINVVTKKPQEGFYSEIPGEIGSFGYWSIGGYFTGGNKIIQVLVGYNYSESAQYEDGDGNKLSSFNPTYNNAGKDMKAFKKHDIWAKLQFKPNDNHTILFSYTYGDARDIMTPRVGMDIESEKTNLTRIEYTIAELGDFSKKITFSLYYNKIEHEPSNKYRTASSYLKNYVKSTIFGGKIENEQLTEFATLTYGFDFYYRNWDGYQINKDTGVVIKPDFFPDANALNLGLYLKADKENDKWSLSCGIRVDYFETEANDLLDGKLRYSQNLTDTNKNKDTFLSGYLFITYHLNKMFSFFGGVGRSIRTPTLVERYIQVSPGFYGNPDLEATKNTELDFGFKTNLKRVSFKIKGFYSWLKDYIYQQAPPKTWTNIDAHIYGVDVAILADIGNNFFIEAAAAYQRGEKDSQPLNNTDKDLAQIPPLKTKLALKYDNSKLFGTLEWIHSEDDSYIDIDAGEQKLKGWDVVNARIGYRYKNLIFHFGVDNIFNKKYAVSNSYEWDVVAGAEAKPKIVNEPGRFFYANIFYSF